MMNEHTIQVGDVVAIRGDRRINYNMNRCAYTPDQLVDGKYVKHTGHGGVWTGRVDKIDPKGEFALVGGGWRPVTHYERWTVPS
jgi:hypothetical protein